MKCELCSEERTSIAKLSKHIRDTHPGVGIRAYYDMYLKKKHEGSCLGCSKPTRYVNMGKGYKPTCSKVCGIKKYRERQKNDPLKHAQFVAKVKANQARIWAERAETDEGRRIRERIGSTISASHAEMTSEERKERFGWMNKLSPEEKKRRIEEILDKSLRPYLERTRKIYDETQFLDYRDSVRCMTERTYKKYRKIINPHGLRRSRYQYHLDHKLSIIDGFIHKIPVEVVSSIHNLVMLSALDNLSKNSNSSITPEELLEAWQGDS